MSDKSLRLDVLPPSVGWLGYGGLLPFVLLAVLCLGEPAHEIIYRGALFSYGAVILSFVGAIHWGLAMAMPGLSVPQRRSCFIWSVVPALMAWVTILFGPLTTGLILILGFLMQYARDLVLCRDVELPAWFLPFRLRLTAVACASLAIGVVSVY
jgi:hydrogenase/urease accessory protein HupE